MSTVVQLEEYVDSCSVQLLHQFERLATLGPIDLGEWLQMYGISSHDKIILYEHSMSLENLHSGENSGFSKKVALSLFMMTECSEGYRLDSDVGKISPWSSVDGRSSVFATIDSTSFYESSYPEFSQTTC